METKHRIALNVANFDTRTRTIDQIFQKKAPTGIDKSSNASKKYFLARALVKWTCMDLHPFSAATTTAFKDLCIQLNLVKDSSEFPDESTLRKCALNDVYKYLLKEVKEKTALIDYGCLSIDIWTDNHRRVSYADTLVHYINNQWELKTLNLRAEEFEHPHTGKIIKTRIEDTLSTFGLDKNNLFCVSDSGSNIILAMKLLDMTRIPCIGHNLHLLLTADSILNKEVPEIQEILLKVKKNHRAILFQHQTLKKMMDLENYEKLIETIESHGKFICIYCNTEILRKVFTFLWDSK